MQRKYCSGQFLRVFSRFGLFSLLILAFSPITAPDVQSAQLKERRAEVTYSVNLNAPAEAKNVRLWLPNPMSDATGLIVFGVLHEEMGEVLFNACMLCLSCIGMG